MENFDEPVIEVNHKDLERYDDSMYKSVCPKCNNGILLIYREHASLKLLANDVCVSCGQHFKYLDIEEMNKLEEGK
jgi:predicted RNA-binding Zn-ribbon protein involved in translation (DUF1610 family)